MKLVFLASTKADLRWFKRYYVSVFPQGRSKADKQFLALQKALKANPFIGHPSDITEGTREFPVLQTPFSFIYRVREDRIEILRVIDNRADWEAR